MIRTATLAIVTFIVFAVTGMSSAASAQESINFASLGGRVTDTSGAVLVGARVVLRHTETNVTATTISGRDGRFRFPSVKVGPYEITVSQKGFAKVTQSLAVTVGAAFDVPFVLTVGSVEAAVTVSTEATTLEAARSQVAGTVSQGEIQSMPLNGRNALDLALLIPGVSPTNVASTQLFAETSAVPGAGISVGSQRNFSNNFIVDGLSANDDAAGLSGIPPGVDAVDQFQVVTSGGQAELGRALGGYINVVTRSGTNTAHGDAFSFFRDDRLNAANPILGRVLPMNQQQFGASLGGPLQVDRSFFFANVERRRLNQSGLTTISADTLAAITARLTATGYSGAPVTTGLYPNPLRSTNALVKVDHQAGARDQFTARYALYRVTADNSRGAGGTSAASASAGLDNTDHTIAIANTLVISPQTLNETRAQVAYSRLAAVPVDPIGPAVTIQGVASFGTLSGSPTGRQNRLYEFVDTLSHQAGAHALRAGADFLYNDDTITFPRSIRGAYTFSSLANFLAGSYGNAGFTQTFGAAVVHQTNPNLGVFAQDEWHAGVHLTVNAGVRYDLQWLQTIATDTNNVSPRLGFVWSPSASLNTIVRGSAGVFYDRVPLRALANALLSAGNTTDVAALQQTSISLSPGQAGAPVFPNILAAPVPLVTLVNFTTMDRHMQNAFSQQAAIEVEHRLGTRSTVSIGYQYMRGNHLIIQVNQNVPTCVAVGTNNGCRPNASYANNSQYSPLASSTFNGLHVSFVQRPVQWGSYRVSYNFSKAMDNVGEFFFSSPIDPFDLSKDWARSDDDQRHRLVVNGELSPSSGSAATMWTRALHDLHVSGTLQYYSALPLNITSGVTTVQGTAGRPIVNGAFIGRNAGTGPNFLSLNLRLSRSFKLRGRGQAEALIEAFNLTNHRNVVTMIGNFGSGAYPMSPSATFGQVTGVADSRTGQVGIRVRF